MLDFFLFKKENISGCVECGEEEVVSTRVAGEISPKS